MLLQLLSEVYGHLHLWPMFWNVIVFLPLLYWLIYVPFHLNQVGEGTSVCHSLDKQPEPDHNLVFSPGFSSSLSVSDLAHSRLLVAEESACITRRRIIQNYVVTNRIVLNDELNIALNNRHPPL